MVSSILWTPERDLSTSFVTRGPAGSHAPFEDQPEPRRTLAVITAQLSSSLNWSSVAPRPPPPPLFATTVHYNRPPYPAAPASCYRRPRGRPRNRSSWIAFAVNTPRRPISVTARSGNRRRAFYNACQRPPRCPLDHRHQASSLATRRRLLPAPIDTAGLHRGLASQACTVAGPNRWPTCPSLLPTVNLLRRAPSVALAGTSSLRRPTWTGFFYGTPGRHRPFTSHSRQPPFPGNVSPVSKLASPCDRRR